MKSYNNLFDKLITDENILEAICRATLGKRDRKGWSELYQNRQNYIKYFRNEVINFHNDKHIPKEIYDGITRKKRIIIVPTMREQVIHHMVVQILKSIVLDGLYEHSYGSIPGRGVHSAKNSMNKWIRNDKDINYVLKCDISKYFPSINHNKLKVSLKKRIRDKRFYDLLSTIIDVNPFGKGLPLGFYTSQWLSMFFLKEFDHYIRYCFNSQVLHYMRYVDDIVIMCKNKEDAMRVLKGIEIYLKYVNLKLNNKTQIYPLDSRDIDFMGFRFFRNKIILRKSIMIKMTRKANHICKKKYVSIYEIRQMMAYIGWLKACQIYNVWIKYVKPYFKIKEAKKRISKYDKRRLHKCGTMQNLQLDLIA